jgi:signal transduction histidine kinase
MKVNLLHSIRTRLVIMLVGFTAMAIFASWFINRTFLEDYYIENKTEDLVAAYQSIDEAFDDADKSFTRDETMEMAAQFETEGISVLVVDSQFKVTFSSGFGITSEILLERLKDILLDNTSSGDVIQKSDNYVVQKIGTDSGSREYLEMWGQTGNGSDFFILRSSLESISDAVDMATDFYLRAGLMILTVGILVMMVFSIRFTKPILQLTDISKKMSDLNFDAKYEVKGKDEIAELGQNMNQLSEILERTISELKSANVKLETDIKKKTEIDEMRKEFLSNVSHELKTPIALIQGYAEGLKESVNDDDESRDFYCDVIIDESAKMNKMVKKLLTLNQIEFGNNQIEMERFDLVSVIDQVLNKENILLQEKHAEVFFDNQKKLFVWADEFQTEEVLTNYITNAINHLDFECRIIIETEEKENLVRVNVFNSGKAIAEEDLEKIWIKFYKVDKARTREYGGSGIGLSIVKAIMDSMNMKCGVENRNGGVNFWFELEKEKNIG